MIKRALSTLPILGALALAMPTEAAPGMSIGAPSDARAPSYSDLVLVQGGPKGSSGTNFSKSGPPSKSVQFKGGPSPKGGMPKGGAPKVIIKVPPRHSGTRYVWGGLPFVFYDGYYHGDCSWLRRKARETGSSYWWSRYRKCRDD